MPDTSKQLVVVPEREPLSEQEARRVGAAANRLPRLRRLYKNAVGSIGRIVVGSSHQDYMPLGSLYLQAALALLIERDEMLLASFNVKIERPGMRAIASVVYEVVAEFEDDGETDLRSQAYEAILDEAPSGTILDVIIEDVE